MSSSNIEDIIGSLYDMVQDARTMPLAADKCILERDRVLDMLDEVIAQMPGELKQARTIVESRNDLINQARREAEGILRQAGPVIAVQKLVLRAGKGDLHGVRFRHGLNGDWPGTIAGRI